MQETVTYIETRQRGLFGKIVIGIFAVFNALMLAWLISYMGSIGELHSQSASDAQKAGTAIGGFVGTGMLLFVWTLGDLILSILVFATRGKKIITAQSISEIAAPASNQRIVKYSALAVIIILTIALLTNVPKSPSMEQNIGSSKQERNELPQNWAYIDRTDPMTDSSVKSLIIKTANVPNAQAYGLSIQCIAGEFDVYVVVPNTTIMTIKPEIAITTRIDSQQPQTSNWIVADDKHGAYNHDPKKFVQSIQNAQKLLIRFETIGHQEKLLELDIANMKQHAAKVTQSCGLSDY